MVLLACGIALLLAGCALGTGAWLVQSAFGGDGRMLIPMGTIPAGDARTVIVDIDRFSAATAVLGAGMGPVGQARLSFRAESGPLEVAVGDSEQVDSFLRGSAYAVARHEGGAWQTVTVPGTVGRDPADQVAPAGQGEWLARSRGSAPEIAIPDHRPVTLVMAGTGPLHDVAVDAVVAVEGHRGIVLGLAVSALVLVVIGACLTTLGARSARTRARHAAPEGPA